MYVIRAHSNVSLCALNLHFHSYTMQSHQCALQGVNQLQRDRVQSSVVLFIFNNFITTQATAVYAPFCHFLFFLFYCPFILFYIANHFLHHQLPICFSVSSFCVSVDHFHTNVSNVSKLTHKAQHFKKRDTLVTILQRLIFFFSFQKNGKVNK